MVRVRTGPVPRRAAGGFSLVELIVVIVISGILASVVGIFITGPIQGYFDQARRAALVDAAQLALTRMGRDLRAALPNSIRINGAALELLLTLDGDRYRTELPGPDTYRLSIGVPDSSFNTFRPLAAPSASPVSPYSVRGALAVYPLQQPGANPYVAASRVMTRIMDLSIEPVQNPAGSGRTEYRVSWSTGPFSPAHTFPFDSPTRRIFLVGGPVTWLCSGGQLLRYEGYAVTETQAVPPAGVTPIVVARDLETCSFQYAAGTAQRNAVVSASLVLQDRGERVRLLRQVHVSNSP